MKKRAIQVTLLAALALVAGSFLAACSSGNGLNPLVGKWAGTASSATWTEDFIYELHNDMTLSMTCDYSSIPPGGVSKGAGTGVYEVDTAAKTIAMSLTVVYTQSSKPGPSGAYPVSTTDSYSLSGNTLVLNDPTWGTVTMTRQ